MGAFFDHSVIIATVLSTFHMWTKINTDVDKNRRKRGQNPLAGVYKIRIRIMSPTANQV